MDNLNFIRDEISKMQPVSGQLSDFEHTDFEDKILSMKSNETVDEVFSFNDDLEEHEVSENDVITSYLVGEEIEVDFNTDEEVIIGDVHDVHGKLSERVQEIMDNTGYAVIPFEAAGILTQVVDLKNHEIWVLDGQRYIMSKQLRMNIIESFKQSIITTLESGMPYSKLLTVDILIGTQSYMTFMLSKYEWSFICGLFRRYNSRVIHNAEGQLMLMVG